MSQENTLDCTERCQFLVKDITAVGETNQPNGFSIPLQALMNLYSEVVSLRKDKVSCFCKKKNIRETLLKHHHTSLSPCILSGLTWGEKQLYMAYKVATADSANELALQSLRRIIMNKSDLSDRYVQTQHITGNPPKLFLTDSSENM